MMSREFLKGIYLYKRDGEIIRGRYPSLKNRMTSLKLCENILMNLLTLSRRNTEILAAEINQFLCIISIFVFSWPDCG